MIWVRVLSIIGLGGSVAWLVFIPGFEPMVTSVGALSALISTFFMSGPKKNPHHSNSASNKLYGNPNVDIKDMNTHRSHSDSAYDD